jgi:hypothetical protein
MNYTIPPRSKASDYAKGKLTQNEIISLQIKNDANIAAARKAIKMGEVQQLTPEQALSPDELLADDAAQEATARTNVMKLGFRDQEAAQIVTNIRNNASLDFTTLNANFPAIEADIRKRFNVKLLTPAFFVEYLIKYSDELAGSAGMRVFQPNNAGFNGMIDNVTELRAVLPDPAIIEYIRRAAEDSRVVGVDILTELNRLKDLLPTARDLQALSNLDPVRQQRIIDDLLVQFQNMPSEAEVRQLANLIQADQIDRRSFIEAIRGIVSSAPQGRQRNIVEDELGSTTQTEAYNEQAERARRRADADRRTAQTAIDVGGDPRQLTPTQQAIYAQLTGVTRVAPTKEQMSSVTGDTGTTAETLGSAIALDTATLTQIKATLRLNPDLAAGLMDSNGNPVNYNDLQLSQPKAGSRKVWIQDTNIRALFQTKYGRGLLLGKGEQKGVRPNIKMKVGRGLAVKETPSYREYGKYAIHIPQLEQQDILNVKYKSLGQIPKFKPIPVSDIFRDFIIDLVENGKPNARVYTQISPEERKFFEEMSIGAGVWNGLGLKRTTTSTDEEENKRFELLKGEYIAGNNNPKVISELRKLVVKMMSDGRIRKNQGVELLMELSI